MPNDYTKTAIKAAFIRLLNERPLNKISVKSIVDICNISRNTFYYHYQDIPSLLEEIIIEAANTLTQQHDTALSMDSAVSCCRIMLTQQHDTALSMETCIESAYEFAKNNRRAVYHIYNSIDRNAYEDFLMRMCAHTARLVVGEMTPDGKIAPEDRDALIYFAKCQFFGLCMDWTKSGMNDNIVEKYRRAVRLLTDMSHGE